MAFFNERPIVVQTTCCNEDNYICDEVAVYFLVEKILLLNTIVQFDYRKWISLNGQLKKEKSSYFSYYNDC